MDNDARDALKQEKKNCDNDNGIKSNDANDNDGDNNDNKKKVKKKRLLAPRLRGKKNGLSTRRG